MNTSTLCYIIGVAVWLELDIGNVRGVSSAFSTAAARCNNCNLLLSDLFSQYTQTQRFTTNATNATTATDATNATTATSRLICTHNTQTQRFTVQAV